MQGSSGDQKSLVLENDPESLAASAARIQSPEAVETLGPVSANQTINQDFQKILLNNDM